MFSLAIFTIAGTNFCYMVILPKDEVDRKSRYLLKLANKGELQNKKFNELFFQSESKQVELLVIVVDVADLDKAKLWVKNYIENNYVDDRKNDITNLDDIYHDKVSTVVMLKHSEEPGFVVILTNNYDRVAADRDMALHWYKLVATKLPRLDAMIKRSGIEGMYHQVILSGDRGTCVDKAQEMLTKYSDDIRCLNYNF